MGKLKSNLTAQGVVSGLAVVLDEVPRVDAVVGDRVGSVAIIQQVQGQWLGFVAPLYIGPVIMEKHILKRQEAVRFKAKLFIFIQLRLCHLCNNTNYKCLIGDFWIGIVDLWALSYKYF